MPLALRFHIGLDPFDAMPTHCIHGHPLAHDSYEFLSCMNSRRTHTNRVHDAQVHLLAQASTFAGRPTKVEPRPFAGNRMRPDISSINMGPTDMVDVYVKHSSTPNRLRAEAKTPFSALQHGHDEKVRRYSALCIRENATIVPFGLTTHGALSKSADGFLTTLYVHSGKDPALNPSHRIILHSVAMHREIASTLLSCITSLRDANS